MNEILSNLTIIYFKFEDEKFLNFFLNSINDVVFCENNLLTFIENTKYKNIVIKTFKYEKSNYKSLIEKTYKYNKNIIFLKERIPHINEFVRMDFIYAYNIFKYSNKILITLKSRYSTKDIDLSKYKKVFDRKEKLKKLNEI